MPTMTKKSSKKKPIVEDKIMAEYLENQPQLDPQFDKQLTRILREIEPAVPGLLVHRITDHAEKVDGCPLCTVLEILMDTVCATYIRSQQEAQ